MGWRRGENWFDGDSPSFDESADGATASLEVHAPAFFGLSLDALAAAIPDGLAESRRRRAELRRRRSARKTQTAAIVIGPAVLLGLAAPRLGNASRVEVLAQDPPSATDTRRTQDAIVPTPVREAAPSASEASFPAIRWNSATSHGLPYAGRLSGGTQLPLEGPTWVTWNPVADRVPNEPDRLYGNERMIRALLAVMTAYRAGDPDAPRIVVGDISFRGGGPMELHRSHQNGLDVDIYYPRRDGRSRPPTRGDQIDRSRAQDLVDRFLDAGVEKIFVGYSTELDGPNAVVIPYPNHGDHMHVRFRP
ncbi:MAG TPA: penicillin-insensitive murein endopeptidase [Gaiellaceae bacterium]|nr:penicillin-insensitive murein endopeptidase [Gaiellaceae bacterium]